MDGSHRRRNLLIAGAAAAAVVCAGYDLWLWLASYASDNFHNDFTFYYAAARLGLTHGWAGLYDLTLQQGQLDAIGSHIRIAQLARFVSPPPLAWLVVPFTVLPYQVAYWVWSALLLAALWLTWQLAAPGRARSRVLYLVAAIGWLPVVYGLQLGQPALLVAAAVAVCCALLRRDREVAAGAVLALLVLKPQLALLVPVALLVTGRWRAFGSAAVVLAALAVASVLALGLGGVSTYLERLSFATTVPENQSQTLAAFIGSLQATRAVQLAIAAWTLALAYRLRARGPETTLAVALVGGLAASPYVHYDDLAMLGLAVWLYLRTRPPRRAWIMAGALVLAGEGLPVWGAGPVLAGELLALLLLSVPGLEHGRGGSERDRVEGAHDAGLEGDRQHVAAVDGLAKPVDRGARQP
jgi:alpha-1,2-mannosyltransferase